MIEKEFKELINVLEVSSSEKKDISNFLDLVITVIEQNISKSFKLVDIVLDTKVTDCMTTTKDFDIMVCLSPRNKTLPYELLQKTIFNEVENAILLNLKNNLIFKESLPIISSDLKNNLLRMGFSDYNINFLMRFKRDSLYKTEISLESKSFYYEQYVIQTEFKSLMKKTYSRFGQTMMLIKKFAKDLMFDSINDLIISIILGYSLSIYEPENSYIGYLKSFVNGLSDLIEEKTIIVGEELYRNLKVLGTVINDSNKYKVIDVANKQNNFLADCISIKEYKELKSYIIAKFPKDGAYVAIDCSPNFILKDKSIEWSFKICNTEIANNGGEYEYTDDNYKMCVYKAVLKGMQFITKNKLGNNIVVMVPDLNAFPVGEDMKKLSYENQSRYANVLAYAKEFDLGLEYKKITS